MVAQLRFDEQPVRATLLAGPATAVGAAIKSRDLSALTTIELVYTP